MEGRPKKMRDGTWGVALDEAVEAGTVLDVTVVTKAGKARSETVKVLYSDPDGQHGAFSLCEIVGGNGSNGASGSGGGSVGGAIRALFDDWIEDRLSALERRVAALEDASRPERRDAGPAATGVEPF